MGLFKRKKKNYIPAIPPEDYEGSIADWMVNLQMCGLWNGKGWYGDVMLPEDVWWDLLEACEG